MRYIKFYLIAIFCGSLMLQSCDQGFEELNKNPNEPTAIPAGLLMADPLRVAANSMYSTFWGGDMGACWAQQWTKVQYNDEERYTPRESVIENTVWKNYYEAVVSDARTMRTLAIAEENKNLEAIAMTIEAFGFQVLTDAFGDIPFSEALDPTNLQPKYDSQADVYAGILTLLDQAIATYGSGATNAGADLLYGGDANAWSKFASSLKFRALMRISGKQSVGAELQALVDAGNLFSSSADNAGLNYLSANPNANPIYETVVFGTRGEWKVNSRMVDLLTDLSDPRLPVYVAPNGSGELRGKPAGIFDVPNDDYNYDNVSPLGTHFLNPELPGYFLTYSELMFLRAEAAFKGYTNEDAKTAYDAGVSGSFADSGLSGASDYLTQSGVAFNTTDALELIATQNWIGLFGQGFEAWTEYRRTGFPVLELAEDPTPGITRIPTRYTYPAIEQSVNKDSYNAAVAAQGANSLITPIWWMN